MLSLKVIPDTFKFYEDVITREKLLGRNPTPLELAINQYRLVEAKVEVTLMPMVNKVWFYYDTDMTNCTIIGNLEAMNTFFECYGDKD